MAEKKKEEVKTKSDIIAEVNKYLIGIAIFCTQFYSMLLLNSAWCAREGLTIDVATFAIQRIKQFGGFGLAVFGIALVLYVFNKILEKKKSLLVVCVTAVSVVTIIYSIILSLSMVNLSSLF